MKKDTTDRRRQDFVEEMGIAVERAGLPRMAGRILGQLLIAPAAEVSSDELVGSLNASRGSVSTMSRLLIQMGLIERVGHAGDRRDYFRLRPGAWTSLMQARLDNVIEFHRAIDHGLRAVTRSDAMARARLEDVHEVYSFFEREFREMMTRWGRHRSTRTGKTR